LFIKLVVKELVTCVVRCASHGDVPKL